jgi:diguanylate cyclase (GGDEF)-like protein
VFRILAHQAAAALGSIALFEQVQELARRDGLTLLFNHSHFLELLDAEVARSRRYRRPVSVLFIDIDHFKQVNDTYGHPFGNVVLCQLARLIRSNVRSTDQVGRYGGEEFIVLLPETLENEAVALAERLRSAVQVRTFQALDVSVRLTVSIGLAGFGPDEVGMGDELIMAADAALLQAKTAGRNRVFSARAGDCMERAILSSSR